MLDKKILIVTPFFFDYHIRIKNALTDKGAFVDLMDEQPDHNAIARICMRKNMAVYHSRSNKYFERKLRELNDDYDYVLYIKCEVPTLKALKGFREKFKRAKHILYLWDSVKNITGITEKFSFFDKIYSFDNKDVEKYPFMTYAYWGYTKEFDVRSEAPEYDLAFVGTLHSIRPTVLKQLDGECERLGLSFYKYIYMPHPLVYFYNKLRNPHFKGVKYKDISFKSISAQDTIEIYKRSRAVLEIENVYQSGATTRFGEMVGMQKKIVTTYPCKNMDIYNPSNQLVLDVKDVRLNKEFFASPYEKPTEELQYKYSFDNFIDTVFS